MKQSFTRSEVLSLAWAIRRQNQFLTWGQCQAQAWQVVPGAADVLTARVSGSGNLHVEDCPVKTATVFVTGSGNLYCYVLELLQATVSGSGNVWYRGAPVLDLNITGSGEVKPL